MENQPDPPLRVLIVDDEPLLARVLTRMLRGHHVTTKASFGLAQEALTEGRFDLAFCDVNLAGHDGRELLWLPLAAPPFFVLMSGSPPSTQDKEAMESGAYGWLSKPFHMADLRQYLQRPSQP